MYSRIELLDARIAFEGELMWKNKKARAQDRFLRGGQIAYMIYEHFRATGAHEAALALPDLFTVSSQGDDIQDLVQDGTEL